MRSKVRYAIAGPLEKVWPASGYILYSDKNTRQMYIICKRKRGNNTKLCSNSAFVFHITGVTHQPPVYFATLHFTSFMSIHWVLIPTENIFEIGSTRLVPVILFLTVWVNLKVKVFS